MKFRELPINSVFEFSSVLPGGVLQYSGAERGPWVKISARKYRKEKPDKTWAKLLTCRVGSINVHVQQLTPAAQGAQE